MKKTVKKQWSRPTIISTLSIKKTLGSTGTKNADGVTGGGQAMYLS